MASFSSSQKPPRGFYKRNSQWAWMNQVPGLVFPMWEEHRPNLGSINAAPRVLSLPVHSRSVGKAPSFGIPPVEMVSFDSSHADRWGAMERFGSASVFPGGNLNQSSGKFLTSARTVNAMFGDGVTLSELTMLAVVENDPAFANADGTNGRQMFAAGTTTTISFNFGIDDVPNVKSHWGSTSFTRAHVEPDEFFEPLVLAVTWSAFTTEGHGFVNGDLRSIAPNVVPITLDDQMLAFIGGKSNNKDIGQYWGKIALIAAYPFAFTDDQVRAWSADPYGFLQPELLIPPNRPSPPPPSPLVVFGPRLRLGLEDTRIRFGSDRTRDRLGLLQPDADRPGVLYPPDRQDDEEGTI